MLKNKYYQYGSPDLQLPVNLNFSEFILNKLMEFKDRTIINGKTHEKITYGQLAQAAMNFAVSLSRLGVGKGQTIAICSENRSEFWSAAIGSICTGAVFSSVNMAYSEYEITHIANISKPDIIICSPTAYKMHEKTFKTFSFVKKIIVFGQDKIPNTISFNDLINIENVKFEDFQVADVIGQIDTLFVLYSSGTTGLPKGVMLTHLNVLISSCSKGIETPSPPVYLIVTPWFHAMGLMGTLLYLTSGRNIVYLPKFEIDLYLDTIQKYKVTRLQVVPPMLVALTKYPTSHDLSSVEMIYSGAAPLRKDTVTAVYNKFPKTCKVLQGYGMTETTLAAIRDNDESIIPKVGGVGKVVGGAVIKVVDLESRKPLGPNQPGEICVKGGNVMKGYVGKDRSEDFDEEGFFRTGDIGYYDVDGYFFIVDRLKELIKYKGYQVPPAEIEAVLLQHPGIRDAGVVGQEHPSAGEVPVAFVVLQPGTDVTIEEIQKFVADRLSNPKHLRGGVRFVSEIPKNPSGKILRRQLRAMLRDSKSKL